MRGALLILVLFSPLIFWMAMVVWGEFAPRPKVKNTNYEGEFTRLAIASRYRKAWRELDDWERRFGQEVLADHELRRGLLDTGEAGSAGGAGAIDRPAPTRMDAPSGGGIRQVPNGPDTVYEWYLTQLRYSERMDT